MTLIRTLVVVVFVALPNFVSADVKTRIVGGSEAAVGEFPFIVSLHERWGHICGGSLIKKNWVLTAGHCVTGTRVSKIYIGLHDQKDRSTSESHSVSRIVRHPQYNNDTMDYDFALIKLSGDSSYEPIMTNQEEIEISDELGHQTSVTTAGWGETLPRLASKPDMRQAANRLQKVGLPLVSKDRCVQGYPNQITDRMICAGYPEGKIDACFGDSGGPMFAVDALSGRPILVGVVSWGEGCARAGKPGVYSKVNSVLGWIELQTAQ